MVKRIKTVLTALTIVFAGFSAAEAAENGSYMLAKITPHYDSGLARGNVAKDADKAASLDSSFRPRREAHASPGHLTFSETATGHGLDLDLERRPHISPALDFSLGSLAREAVRTPASSAASFASAAAVSVAVHELGHVAVGSYVGADGVNVDFMASRDGDFFLGSTTYTDIDPRSKVPFSMGGLFFSDLAFEYSLANYRNDPTVFNQSLMVLSGLDFLRYTVTSLYVTDGHSHHDPVAVVNESALSNEALLGAAIAKTAMNAFRIYSGNDTVVPYFSVDKYSATLNMRIVF